MIEVSKFDIIDSPQFDYVNKGNPTIDVNPRRLYATWLNLTTGELFICVDVTKNLNAWVGQLGTYINFHLNMLSDIKMLFDEQTSANTGTNPIVPVDTNMTYGNDTVYDYASFNGSSGISLGNTNIITTDTFALSLLIKPSSSNAGINVIANKQRGVTTNHYSWVLRLVTEDTVYDGIGLSINDTEVNLVAYNVLTMDSWQHIIVNSGAGGIKIFVDGTSVASTSTAVTPEQSVVYPTRIGCYGGTGYFYIGEIADFRIFDRELSDVEISTMSVYYA